MQHTRHDIHEMRHKIFSSKCTINGKVCSLSIDAGSCANFISREVAGKLCLTLEPHPEPYEVARLIRDHSAWVTERAYVPFSMGVKYQDSAWFDVVTMNTCHVLLGRPWQYDRGVSYDGRKNTYSFYIGQRRLILLPSNGESSCFNDSSLPAKPNPIHSVPSNMMMTHPGSDEEILPLAEHNLEMMDHEEGIEQRSVNSSKPDDAWDDCRSELSVVVEDSDSIVQGIMKTEEVEKVLEEPASHDEFTLEDHHELLDSTEHNLDYDLLGVEASFVVRHGRVSLPLHDEVLYKPRTHYTSQDRDGSRTPLYFNWRWEEIDKKENGNTFNGPRGEGLAQENYVFDPGISCTISLAA
ncbi:uncharacterized protein LOC143891581 [Tasmannia lanceolata]|uniref:uncharacterized protein LOC143891581 n=1 Tax=Tasmannia lanceolata TaxID=3420 RepID=UPI004062CB87